MRLRFTAATLVFLWICSAGAKTHLVVGRGVAWDPRTLEVARGDTVEWKNADVVPHNVRQDKGLFRSKDLPPETSFRWKATKRGTWPYKCTLHPEMTGTIKVN
ncbi:MAG: plastocyanin/azurin family copper-binding protein [Myxococcales bacterium]